MQCADIFFLKTDVCQLGNDQRKVNMLAREYVDKNKDFKKPVIVGHHMLSGMTPPAVAGEGENDDDMAIKNKMSKSNPNSAIFMEDSVDDVNRKVKKAYAPIGMEFDEANNRNPILDYCENIIIPAHGFITVLRKADQGGDKTYTDYQELKVDYCSEALHPGDLKPAVALAINKLLEPVRTHFETDPYAKRLLETIKKWQAELAGKLR
jgi:tyrosyl-tRNA synthetase